MKKHTEPSVPIIDIQALIKGDEAKQIAAQQLNKACRQSGFFYITGHGIDESLQSELEAQSKQFFAQDIATKMHIRMALGGKAWRGYFPVGGELTSGKPDLKEGLYFGTELSPEDKRVQEGLPLHGPNLFPPGMPSFRKTILTYMDSLTQLGHQLMRGIALSLGLEEGYFEKRYMQNPLCLFRIFHYPSYEKVSEKEYPWGVGEHTDYGVLTILKQDDKGGLQIKSRSEWIDAPYIPGTLICNIGDMLDKMTGGYYRSTPHRVRNTSHKGRLSFPFFFDPDWDAQIAPLPIKDYFPQDDDKAERWDKASVHEFEGTYGDYILSKVAKVFPGLNRDVGE